MTKDDRWRLTGCDCAEGGKANDLGVESVGEGVLSYESGRNGEVGVFLGDDPLYGASLLFSFFSIVRKGRLTSFQGSPSSFRRA
jgi:hypothetical protein